MNERFLHRFDDLEKLTRGEHERSWSSLILSLRRACPAKSPQLIWRRGRGPARLVAQSDDNFE